MITKADVDAAIQEFQAVRKLDAKNVSLLASLYTVRDHLSDEPEQKYLPEPEIVKFEGQTDFALLINGRPAQKIWPVIDDLMSIIKTQSPRLYDSIMQRL